MASQSHKVILFDTPSKECTIWSHHVLRIVFSLHYKGIPYSVENIEYPDIVSTFAPTTLEPKSDPIEPYEIPVLKIQTPDGDWSYYMGTVDILQALDDLQPEPSLLYTSTRSAEFRSRFGPALAPIIQAVVGHVPQVLSSYSAKSFAQKRLDRWGKPVEQWRVEHPIGDCIATAETRIKELGEWLDAVPGNFVHGDLPSYADFTIASILAFAKAVGFPDVLQSALDIHPAIGKLYSGVKLTQLDNANVQSVL